MASEYDPIINNLIEKNSVEVVTHKDRVDVLIAMVKKVKSERNRMRKNLGIVSIPKMTYCVVDLGRGKFKVTFTLIHPIVF